MKKLYLSVFLLTLLSMRMEAQTPFNTMDSIDINKVHASVLVHGDMWWDPVAEVSSCHFPGSTVKNINFAGSIWMGAYDGAGQLHVAAQTYRQSGNDYWPGPLDASDTLTYATSQNWAKIWKVNRNDIQTFRGLTVHTMSNTPTSILTWPAKGNANAQGNAGAPLTITDDMAPFVDLNGNGIYEPLLGEYPDVPGDQALWWVFSDNGPTHTVSHGKPLGIEVHAMSYAYGRGTLIDNVVYYDYTLVNRSANNYHDFRIGQWDDIDLGYYLDDYIGFDSTWRMGIGYNGTPDDGGSGGHPSNSYGIDPPQSGLTMIALPGDIGTSYVPAGAFVTYNNDFSSMGDPSNDTVCNNYLHAAILIGGGPVDSSLYTGVLPCRVTNPNYLLPGDPTDTSQWSECNCHYVPGDRRFILASNDFSLNAGNTEHAVFALVVADSAGGCPTTSFHDIKIVADTAWYIYHHPLAPLYNVGINDKTISNSVNIYPNPANNKLYLEDKSQQVNNADITIYNCLGIVINVPVSKSGQTYELDISHLPPGIYYARYINGNVFTNTKFLKQ